MESGGSNLIRHTPVDPYMATINDHDPNEKRTAVTEFKGLRKLFLQKSGNLLIGSTGVVMYLMSPKRSRSGFHVCTRNMMDQQMPYGNASHDRPFARHYFLVCSIPSIL